MLYVSIFLIVAGIVLIVYSFVSRSHVKSTVPLSQSSPFTSKSIYSSLTDAQGMMHGEKKKEYDHFQTLVEKEAEKSHSDDHKALVKSVQSQSVSRDEQKIVLKAENATYDAKTFDRSNNEKFLAVLYYDSTGIVDYESGQSNIDPTFKKYSKLKRIGSGHISVVGDAIHFQMRKKLFRFEFYLIEKIVQGENYLAIFLKGSNEIRLFIFKRQSGLEKNIVREFEAYRRKKI